MVDVVLKQEDTTRRGLRRKTVVLIDVLRATSTLVCAFAAGAEEAWCCRTVTEVFRARRRLSGHRLLLGGERRGLPIRGFNLGNSPRHFTRDRCAGTTLLMTTTNGTRALALAHDAREVILGSFLNLSAASDYLASARGDVVCLCAGTEGQRSDDDVACAGAIIEKLSKRSVRLTSTAEEALRTWRRARRSLRKFLLQSAGGVPLVQVGLQRDVCDCARRDRFSVVPRVVGRKDGYRIRAVRC